MNQQQVESRLNDLIIKHARIRPENRQLDGTIDIIKDLGYNSITLIQLMTKIEEAFGIEFEDVEIHIFLSNEYQKIKNSLLTRLNIEPGKTG